MTKRQLIVAKTIIWVLCLLPLARLTYFGFSAQLGPNPIEFVTLSTGTWTLIFLLASLAVTPFRRLTGRNELIRFRRLLGLFAFFYAFQHLLIYVLFDQQLDFRAMLDDVVKRPFITAGFTAFMLLLPLALTSTAWSIRKLGGKNWNRLHKLVYLSAIAAVIHFIWKVKVVEAEQLIYAGVLAALLGFRILFWARARATSIPATPRAN